MRRFAFVLALAFSASLAAAEPLSRWVSPPGAFPANHGSTVVELADGSLLTCWFAGSAEANRDVRIVCSRLDADGVLSVETPWSATTVAVDAGESAEGNWMSNKFVGNPVLHRDDEGYLWLFYEAVQIGGHSGAQVQYKVSSDEGRTWSRGKVLAGGFADWGHLPRNKPLRLADGRVMVPLYREFTSHYGYTITLTVARGAIVRQQKHVIPGGRHLQPSLVQRPDGTILAYLRNKDHGFVLVSRFTGSGWTATAATTVPNPNAAVDATVDDAGRVVMVANPSHEGRNPLSILVSDDGVRFRKVWDLEARPGGNFAYPAIVRAADGRYHVTWTGDHRSGIKHATFDEGWLLGLE